VKRVCIKLSPEAEEVYRYLNQNAPNSKLERMILKATNQKIELIKVKPHYGDGIPKNLIPEEYKIKYGVTNLFAEREYCGFDIADFTENPQMRARLFF